MDRLLDLDNAIAVTPADIDAQRRLRRQSMTFSADKELDFLAFHAWCRSQWGATPREEFAPREYAETFWLPDLDSV